MIVTGQEYSLEKHFWPVTDSAISYAQHCYAEAIPFDVLFLGQAVVVNRPGWLT